MRSFPLIIIALLILMGFMVYMMSYTVRFTEAAVVATFGKVGPDDVVKEPGLRFKWPSPIQTTTIYDTRARFLQARSETQSTADERQIVVESFVAWRVDDPLLFYQKFRGQAGSDTREHYRKAEEVLTSLLRSATSEVSRFRFSDLFTTQSGKGKLPELEQAIQNRLTQVKSEGGESVAQYGIKVLMVGVSSVVLPEQTTSSVFEAMRAARQKLASVTQAEGNAEAGKITSDATNGANSIRAFASTFASRTESRGELEASQWLSAQAEDPELAEFLKKIDFLRQGFGRRLTLVLPTNMWGLELLGPNAMDQLRNLSDRASQPPRKTSDSSPKQTPAEEHNSASVSVADHAETVSGGVTQ